MVLAVTNWLWESVPLLLGCLQVDPNRLDGSGRAALHYAILQHNVTAVKQFIACPRVDIAVPSADGRTGLAYAAMCASAEAVTLLLGTRRFDLGRPSFIATASMTLPVVVILLMWPESSSNTFLPLLRFSLIATITFSVIGNE